MTGKKETKTETIAIGIIGAGVISDYHIAGLLAAGGVDLRVVSGRDPARVAPVAERYGIPNIATDYNQVLERNDIDAVVVTVPDVFHEEIAVQAAEAGKAILLQKPMACTSDSCRRIIAAASRCNVDLQVSYMHRHFEEVVYARDLLRSKRLGEVYEVRIRNATPGPYKAWFYDGNIVAGGVVMQLGVHGIDLIHHLFGDIESVAAITATKVHERIMPDGEHVRDIRLEDHALAHYTLENGVLVSHEMSFYEAQGTDRFLLEIYCEGGTVLLRTNRGPLAIYAPEVTGVSDWQIPDLPSAPLGKRHHANWLDSLRGVLEPGTTAEDSLAGIVVVEAIYESASQGRRIGLDHSDQGNHAE